jgi:NitT/TauT family transport system substrate-binding protein
MRHSFLSLVCVLFGLASACHPATHVNTHVSLRLSWIPSVTYAGDYVALDHGYWSGEALDVTLQPGGFQFDALKMVAGGTDTFGITSAAQLLQARANGVPVIGIGAVIPRSPIGWVSKADSHITTPYDFKGRRIGAEFGTHTEVTLEALCAKLKIPLTSFERIAVQFDPRPFVVGKVDVLPVFLIDQPFDLEHTGLRLNRIDPGDYGVSLAYGNMYFTTEQIAKEHPDLVKKFLSGAVRGWKWAHEHRQETIDLLQRHIENSPKEVIAQKLQATFDFIDRGHQNYDGVSPMSHDAWANTYGILHSYGSLSKEIDIDSCFSNQFLR